MAPFNSQSFVEQFLNTIDQYKERLKKNPKYLPSVNEAHKFTMAIHNFSENELLSFHNDLLATPSLYNFYFGHTVYQYSVKPNEQTGLLPLDFNLIQTSPYHYFYNLLNKLPPVPVVQHYLESYFKKSTQQLSIEEQRNLFAHEVLKGCIQAEFKVNWLTAAPHWSSEQVIDTYIEVYQKTKSKLTEREQNVLLSLYRFCPSQEARKPLLDLLLTYFDSEVFLKQDQGDVEKLRMTNSIFNACPEIYAKIEEKDPLFFEKLKGQTQYEIYNLSSDPDTEPQPHEIIYYKLNILQYAFVQYAKKGLEATEFFTHFAAELNEPITQTVSLVEQPVPFFNVFLNTNAPKVLASIDITQLNKDNQKICVGMAVMNFLNKVEDKLEGFKNKEEGHMFLQQFIQLCPLEILKEVYANPVMAHLIVEPATKQAFENILEQKFLQQELTGAPSENIQPKDKFKL